MRDSLVAKIIELSSRPQLLNLKDNVLMCSNKLIVMRYLVPGNIKVLITYLKNMSFLLK